MRRGRLRFRRTGGGDVSRPTGLQRCIWQGDHGRVANHGDRSAGRTTRDQRSPNSSLLPKTRLSRATSTSRSGEADTNPLVCSWRSNIVANCCRAIGLSLASPNRRFGSPSMKRCAADSTFVQRWCVKTVSTHKLASCRRALDEQTALPSLGTFRVEAGTGAKEVWTAIVSGPDAEHCRRRDGRHDVRRLAWTHSDQIRGPRCGDGFASDHAYVQVAFENQLKSLQHLIHSWSIDREDDSLVYRHLPHCSWFVPSQRHAFLTRPGRFQRWLDDGRSFMAWTWTPIVRGSSRLPGQQKEQVSRSGQGVNRGTAGPGQAASPI